MQVEIQVGRKLSEIIDSLYEGAGDGERQFVRPSFESTIEVTQEDKLYPKRREIFGESCQLNGRTLYKVDGDKDHGIDTFITDEYGDIRWVETHYGYSHSNRELNKLRTGCVYKVGPNSRQQQLGNQFTHWFMTHAFAKSVTYAGTSFFSWAQVSPGVRKPDGKNKKLVAPANSGYDQGHLIACEFGGGMENINIVSMMRESNQYRTQETVESYMEDYKKALQEHNQSISEVDSKTEGKMRMSLLRQDSREAEEEDSIMAVFLNLREHGYNEKEIANYHFMERFAEHLLNCGYEIKLYIPDINTTKAGNGMMNTSILYPRIKIRKDPDSPTNSSTFKFSVDIDTRTH